MEFAVEGQYLRVRSHGARSWDLLSASQARAIGREMISFADAEEPEVVCGIRILPDDEPQVDSGWSDNAAG